MSDEIKASIVFTLALNPNPVSELSKIICVKSKGMFVPAIEGVASLPGGNHYAVKFPIMGIDAIGEKSYEEIRALFHKRIDEAFDGYKKKWEDRQKELEEKAEKESGNES